jgi:hypothetical protein
MHVVGVAERNEEQGEHRIEQWLFILVILLLDCFMHILVGNGAGDDSSAAIDSGKGNALAQAVFSLIYAGAFVGLWVERRRAWSLLRGSWPIVLLVGLICFSSLWSSDPGLTAKRAYGVLGTTAIAYYAG